MKPRFPIGLTLAVAVALVILVGLGAWQVKRLAWKENLLAHIAALKTAAPVPIGPVLARLKAGEDVEWTRVEAVCGPGAGAHNPLRYALRDGKIVWRAQTLCRLADAPYTHILLDRGYAEDSSGKTLATSVDLPPPGKVIGLLRNLHISMVEQGNIARTALPAESAAALPPLALVAEHEDPAPPGVTPSGLPEKISNNHLSYALTWFGLAGAMLAVYAAMLFRRLKPAA